MGAQQQMYEFMTGIINLVTHPNGLWRLAGPFLLMLTILRVILWSRGAASGERETELLGDADRLQADYRDRGQQLGQQVRRLRDNGRRRP